ncbi:hypothetical protein [Paraburkholderia sp. MM5477-R1]|uniref:hypothetical protein n=1 Tax=Paraburkholderia sp. MM5477-R1 TaxID=2991062 RepID=UPI003D2122E4
MWPVTAITGGASPVAVVITGTVISRPWRASCGALQLPVTRKRPQRDHRVERLIIMRILVAGGTGLLGGRLIAELVENGNYRRPINNPLFIEVKIPSWFKDEVRGVAARLIG